MSTYTVPSFLGIGPPKTATTWLYQALSYHPEIYLPPMKEVGYLYEKNFFPNRNYFSLFFNKHWYYRARRWYIKFRLINHLKSLKQLKINREISWDLFYLLFPHTDSWYVRLFDRNMPSGDITPQYYQLSESQIFNIKKNFGFKKIIITIRDPIELEWSRAKMNLCKKKNKLPNEIPEENFIKAFENTKTLLDYTEIYESWSKVFGKENIHLIFYDEIQDDSWKVFNELCEFLEISKLPRTFKSKILQPNNVGIPDSIPDIYENYLFSLHKDKILKFAEKFSSYKYPWNWLEKHNNS